MVVVPNYVMLREATEAIRVEAVEQRVVPILEVVEGAKSVEELVEATQVTLAKITTWADCIMVVNLFIQYLIMEDQVVAATTEVAVECTGVVVAGAPATAPVVILRHLRTTLTPAPAMRWWSSLM